MSTLSKPVQQLTPFGAALAGALGGCFSNAVVYPLDVVKTRIQASHADRDPAERLAVLPLLLRILKREGVAGYYRGFAATMLNTFSMQYAYFFFYSVVRTSYLKRAASKLPKGSKAPALSTAMELLLGAIAGALAQIFTIPVSVIATRQQIGPSSDAKRTRAARKASISYAAVAAVPPADAGAKEAGAAKQPIAPVREDEVEDADDSFLGVAREIVEEEGVAGLWLGIKPGLVLTVNPAITYGVYERMKGAVLAGAANPNAKLSPGRAFVLGALSKTLATVVTYPYIMAKVRIQARSADVDDAAEHRSLPPPAHATHHKNGQHHVGALDILARVWKHEGFLGWYQGMGAQITKAVLSQGVLFMSKDQFEHWALAIMAILYRFRG